MKFKNCNQFKMPLLDLVPPPPQKKRNMNILLLFLRNYTGFLLKKESF